MSAYRSGDAGKLGVRTVAAPITEVTVLEDRAVVTRRTKLDLPPGQTTLEIAGVAPVLIDKSLVVEVVGSDPESVGAARVADARAVRQFVREDGARPADLADLDAAVKAAEARCAALRDRRWRIALQAEGLAQLFGAFLSELAEDASRGVEPDGAQTSEGKGVLAAERELRRELARLGIEEEQAKRELAQRVERRASAERPDGVRSLRLEITLDVRGEARGSFDMIVRYVVPNVSWRPRHRATLDATAKRLEIAARGTIWQNTGEDWAAVRVSLSTARPSLGASPPRLATDWLRTVRKGPLVVEAREETIEQAGVVDGPRAVIEDLPRIDDGGEARVIALGEPMSIPSDGRPHTADLFRFETEVEVSLVVAPELCLAALVRAVGVNSSGRPLLAGPVELVRGGGAVGRASIGFVAPGEKLVLGFGPDPAIAVHREIEPIKDESNLLGSWQTKTHDVVVKLSNLGPQPKRLRVEERVLVSEIEKVQSHVVESRTTGNVRPDENGFVRWSVELGPHAKERLVLRVAIKRHSDVIG